MRRIMTLATGFGLLTGAASSGVVAQIAPGASIAYIHSEAILAATPEVQEARTALGQDFEQLQGEVDRMQASLDSLISAFQQQQLTMSAETKELRRQEIEAKQREYGMRVQQMDQQAAARQQELMAPVMERISAVIEEMRTERGYSVIFDASTQSIIAADPALDITEEVIRRLGGTIPGGTTGGPGGPSGADSTGH